MKRIALLIIIICSCLSIFSQATEIVVDCQTPGWLSSKINYGDQQTVKNLKVTGYINSDDLHFIGGLMENYQLHGRVDLSDVGIVGNKMDEYTNNFGITKDPSYSIQYLALPRTLTELDCCLCSTPAGTSQKFLKVDTLLFAPTNINYVRAGFFDGRQYQSSIKHLILGEKIDSIPDGAFWDKGGVSSLKLPVGMRYIGERAFYQNYKSIEDVNFNDLENLKYLGYGSFCAYAGTNDITYYQPDTLIIPKSLDNPFYLRAFSLRDGQHIFIEDNINEVSTGEYNIRGRWLSSSLPAKLIFHINNVTPPALTSYQVSSNTNLSQSVVYVPKGSKQAYMNSTWGKATIIEVDSPRYYSLTIKTTGNGSVTYDGITIRNDSHSFTIKEGTEVVGLITPDEGYRVGKVLVNGSQVTDDVTGLKKFTIKSMDKDNVVSIEFEAIPVPTYSLYLLDELNL